jgi:hypothetical protein
VLAAWDDDQLSPKIYFNVTNTTWASTSYITLGGYNQTNSSGYVTRHFYANPDCSYNTSNQSWFAYTAATDACYQANQSAIYNVTVKGSLYPNVTWPNGSEYEESIDPDENKLNITGQLLDECLARFINDSTVNFTIIHNASNEEYQCTSGITNYNNGTYECEWNWGDDGDNADSGYYDVIMNATDVTYFNNGSLRYYSVFRLIPHQWSPPDINNETLILEEDGGWGENFTFRVNISDVDAEDVAVELWFSDDNATWTDREPYMLQLPCASVPVFLLQELHL